MCPHCGKEFEGELLASDSTAGGYKCPHCRLFVPAAHGEAQPHAHNPDAAA